MVESRFCSWVWSSAGVAHHGVAYPSDANPVWTRARLAGLVLAGLRVFCSRSSGDRSCGVVGARLSWPPHGRLGLREFHRAVAGVVSPNVVCVAGTSVSVLVSCVLVCPSVVLCSLLTLVGRVRNGSVAVFCCVRGYGRWRAWRTTVSPTCWTRFPFRPVHAWLVWCWPACVWSVYGQVAAAAAVWSVRGCLGRLMVGLVCVGSVALLPVVVSPNVVCVAGMSVFVLVSCVLVCPSVV